MPPAGTKILRTGTKASDCAGTKAHGAEELPRSPVACGLGLRERILARRANCLLYRLGINTESRNRAEKWGGLIMHKDNTRADHGVITENALNVVSEALSRLRYGTIQLTVHDGTIMQIDVTEKKRLTD